MKSEWKSAVRGALGGAILAITTLSAVVPQGLSSSGHGGGIRKAAEQKARDDDARQGAVDRLGQNPFFDPLIAFISGPANSKRTVVEFFDYNCTACRATAPAMMKFYYTHRNDTRFAFIEYPIEGPNSTLAARAALAARKQPDKYMAFHFTLMSEYYLVNEDTLTSDARIVGLDLNRLQRDMKAPEVDAAIAKSRTLAYSAKISGVPGFIVNGRIVQSDLTEADLNRMVALGR